MHHRRAPSAATHQVAFIAKIPFRRPVRVIDQASAADCASIPQPAGSSSADPGGEKLAEHPENRNGQENKFHAPRVDPAQIAPHRRHRRATGKPQLPAAILLRADIGSTKSIVVVTGSPVIFLSNW